MTTTDPARGASADAIVPGDDRLRRLLAYESLLLPLAGDSGGVDHVMIGVLMNGA